MKWRQAVAEAADWSLPLQVDTQAGQLAYYLERLRCRMVDDLDAARRNAVGIYPEEFAAFQVYIESYHKAVAKRLRTITSGPLQITDVYAMLDWFYNIYSRYKLWTVTAYCELIFFLQYEKENTVWDIQLVCLFVASNTFISLWHIMKIILQTCSI